MKDKRTCLYTEMMVDLLGYEPLLGTYDRALKTVVYADVENAANPGVHIEILQLPFKYRGYVALFNPIQLIFLS